MLLRNDTGQGAAEFYQTRWRWAEYLSTLDGLSDRAFRVGFWLSRRMNGEDQCCWYEHKQIGNILGMSVDKVARAIAELEARGVLIVVRTHRKPNSYSIRLPFN